MLYLFKFNYIIWEWEYLLLRYCTCLQLLHFKMLEFLLTPFLAYMCGSTVEISGSAEDYVRLS